MRWSISFTINSLNLVSASEFTTSQESRFGLVFMRLVKSEKEDPWPIRVGSDSAKSMIKASTLVVQCSTWADH